MKKSWYCARSARIRYMSLLIRRNQPMGLVSYAYRISWKAQIMSVQMFSVSERRLQQQKALPMEKPEEAVDERAADESSLLHRNPDRHMREFLEEIQGHGEPKG